MTRERATRAEAESVKSALHDQGFTYLRVQRWGSVLRVLSGPWDRPNKHFRLRKLSGEHWALDLADARGRWKETDRTDSLPHAVEAVLDEFRWALLPPELRPRGWPDEDHPFPLDEDGEPWDPFHTRNPPPPGQDIFSFDEEPTPQNMAEEMTDEAWDAPDPRQAAALARAALRLDPDCADAYNILAFASAKSPEERVKFYRQAVEVGRRLLGEGPFRQFAGMLWGVIEARPYMRGLHGLGLALWEAGEREEAIRIYRKLLRLNVNDNQGIRYELMTCLLELGRDEEAEDLYQEYNIDWSAAWAYSRVLLDFRRHGDSPTTRRALTSALEVNEHVPAFLLGHRKPPAVPPPFYSPGDETEAVLYVVENRRAWEETPGALEWLANRMT